MKEFLITLVAILVGIQFFGFLHRKAKSKKAKGRILAVFVVLFFFGMIILFATVSHMGG